MRNLHITLAQEIWRPLLNKNATVIDATAGNGHDSYWLAKHLFPGNSILYIIDIQKQAIDATKKRLAPEFDHYFDNQIIFIHDSHENLPHMEAQLIIYNLGYLPGGDKAITTTTNSTLSSINQALKLIKPSGLISITCYPGHQEGNVESLTIDKWVEKLGDAFKVYQFKSLSAFGPYVYFIYKK